MTINWRTIRFRLTLWYSLVLGLIVLIFSIYLQSQLQNSLGMQLDDGLQVAGSQILLNIDDSMDPPTFRSISDADVERLDQSRFAVRLINTNGNVIATVGNFPERTNQASMRTGFETVEANGTPWRVFTQPIQTRVRHVEVWLQMAQSLNIAYEARDRLLKLIVIGLPLALLAAAFGGMFMANRALRPVATIVKTVQALNPSELTLRIDYNGPLDELGQLTQTLNSMLDRLQSAFDTERQFTADASHELRTPLTAIKGQIGVTLSRPRMLEEYQSTLRHIEAETDRLIRLVNDLLFLTRLDALPKQWQPERIYLNDLCEAVADQLRPLADGKNIELEIGVPETLTVLGVPDHLIRLLLNLVDNAIKFTFPGGRVTLSARHMMNQIVVCVEDNGPGISAEHLPNLFQRFYRVERARSSNSGGSGLGLAIVYEIVREHQGQIQVKSTPQSGTKFIVSLPAM